MSTPKTIYVHKNICNVVENGELSSTARIDRRWPQDIEYHLVDPNEQSKIERIRAEIKSLAYRKFDVDHPDQLITKARCLEIIDRISNDRGVTVNGRSLAEELKVQLARIEADNGGDS